MANVVDYEEFKTFKELILQELDENRFHREVVSKLLLFSRKQACKILNVSDATMHRIIKDKRIPFHPEGNRQLFYVNDLISYLTAQKINVSESRRRVFDAILQQKTDPVATKSV